MSEIAPAQDSRVYMIEDLILSETGLTDRLTPEELDEGLAAVAEMNAIIQEALDYVISQGGAQEGITADDVLAMNAYITFDPELSARWAVAQGTGGWVGETGFNLLEGNGASSWMFGAPGVNEVLDGMYNLGFAVVDGVFVDEQGFPAVSVDQVADWLNYFFTDYSTTGTELDRVVDTILTDPGLVKLLPADEIIEGAQAANAMSTIIVEAIANVAPDAFENGQFTGEDMVAVNAYINEVYGDQWGAIHGDGGDGIEWGFHLVQADGATTEAFNRNFVNIVADGIYHLGFEVSDSGHLINEDGVTNVSVDAVAAWLNNIMFDTPLIQGKGYMDTLEGTDGAEQILGESGKDTIYGNGGDDLIIGGEGKDNLHGGDGDDTFALGVSGNGFDRYDGGAGYDTIDGRDTDLIQLSGLFEAANSIEAIIGNGDTVIGGAYSADMLDFSTVVLTGIASVNGGGGGDTLIGSAGDDVLNGGFMNDSVTGGAGTDMLIGGWGRDTFIFHGGDGTDTIADFENRRDTIMLSGHDGIDSFDDLDGMITQVGDDAVIDFQDGDMLILTGTSITALDESDVLFSV